MAQLPTQIAPPFSARCLNGPVEQFLGGAGAAFDPGLIVLDPEELRGLHDTGVRVRLHVWQALVEQVVTGREVRVEEQDVVAPGDLEAPQQVA